MKRKSTRGVAFVEFGFVLLVLVPMLLGTTAIGLNMLRTLETIQVARDAGHMYAKGADFSQPGIKTILVKLGGPIGLTTNSSTSKAAIVLSAVTYIDQAACQSDGKADSHGNPLGCTNFGQWVFTQRIVVGNTALATSRLGRPLTSGPDPVVVNATTGKISLDDQVTNAGDVATFTGINPYSVVNGNSVGLPSGEVIYISEALSTGIKMAPFVGDATMYSANMF
jgi:hypothetical protein